MKQRLFLSGAEVVAVGETSLFQAQQQVTGCEACSWSASIPFDALLRELSKTNIMTEYFLGQATECPQCESLIFEKTLIDVDGKTKAALDLQWYEDARDAAQEIVLIDEATLVEAEDLVAGCENCTGEAELLFDQILDAVTGCDPARTEYLICRPAKCGFCNHEIVETTLVVPR